MNIRIQTTAPQRAYLRAAKDWAGHGWSEIEQRFLSQTRAQSAKAEHLLCVSWKKRVCSSIELMALS
jgi:hypothetical protein